MTREKFDLLTPLQQQVETIIAMYARSKKEEMHMKIMLEGLVNMAKKEALISGKC